MGETDQQLVLRARLDDRAAYGELVARHQGRVRGWLRHLCRDYAEADDLAQEAFVRGWTRLGELRDTTRFAQWLMKIAYNAFLQSRRSSRRQDRLTELLETEQHRLLDNSAAEVSHSRSELRRVLTVLSRRERAVVVLNYACGYSSAEVSELTGLPLGTVKSLIFRGSQRVREQLYAPTG